MTGAGAKSSIGGDSTDGFFNGGLNSWMSVAPLDRADVCSMDDMRRRVRCMARRSWSRINWSLVACSSVTDCFKRSISSWSWV
jgi:hypothetical protein